MLRVDARGNGWATEAGDGWTRWAFERLDIPCVTACISPDNHLSRGVAERLGMQVIRRDVLHDREVLVFALQRSGWSA